MTVVVGTAGHIDHGKTTLLRALTGIDADRLPEERRRGMTIDVGYAHLGLPDGSVLDFVDVPGHDRLVGNMLVGAGEIDAALLVVAADDGPNAQTLEHLELLDALSIRDGIAVVTKADLAPDGEWRDAIVAQVAGLLGRTTLSGSPVLLASATTGEGLDVLRAALVDLARHVSARLESGRARGPGDAPRMAIDRVFAVRGRGTVVTGSLRGGPVRPGDMLRIEPDGEAARVREVQARGATVTVADGGRTALLLGGVETEALRRGQVLVGGPSRVVASSRLLVSIRPVTRLDPARPAVAPLESGERLRLHLGTDQVEALVVRGPREAIDLPGGERLAILRLERPVASAPGDAFALRRAGAGSTGGGGRVLDPRPPRGISRRRMTRELAGRLAVAIGTEPPDDTTIGAAILELHGARVTPAGPELAADVREGLRTAAVERVAAHHAAMPDSPGMPITALRQELAVAARRRATLRLPEAAAVARSIVDGLVEAGTLARDGDVVRESSRSAGLPQAVRDAMDRLEAALAVAAPPPLAATARAVGCSPAGVRALEVARRIVRLEDDLAWAAGTYRDLARRALTMAAAAPLTPAAFRDATGTSRRFVLVILEDLDRRGLLRRTDSGHVLGPKAIQGAPSAAGRAAGSEGPG